MTEIIVLDNKKGGVGRTTATKELGSVLAFIFGYCVLLVDNDNDRCITDCLYGGSFEAHAINRRNVLDCLSDVQNGFDGAIIPFDGAQFSKAAQYVAQVVGLPYKAGGVLGVVTGTDELEKAPGYFADHQQPISTFEHSYGYILRSPAIQENWDYILIDNGSGWSASTQAALFAADSAIMPLEPASLSVEAFKRHYYRVQRANTKRKKAGIAGETIVRGALISRLIPSLLTQVQFAQGIRQMLAAEGINCFKTEIEMCNEILVSTNDHKPAWAQFPEAPQARQYAALAKEIFS